MTGCIQNKDASHVIPFLKYALEIGEPFNLDGLTMDVIDDLTGADFEIVCAYLLMYHGFTDVELTTASYDYGIDITARKDWTTYAVQCKRRKTQVGSDPVQEAYAGKAHYHCHKAIVMTNSRFTRSAVQLAKDTGVILFDRTGIERLLNPDEQSECESGQK